MFTELKIVSMSKPYTLLQATLIYTDADGETQQQVFDENDIDELETIIGLISGNITLEDLEP